MVAVALEKVVQSIRSSGFTVHSLLLPAFLCCSMAKNSECQPERGKLWRAALFLMVVFCVLASVAQASG